MLYVEGFEEPKDGAYGVCFHPSVWGETGEETDDFLSLTQPHAAGLRGWGRHWASH